jgi:asparagine synthase (glutamine-hydrolysing)
MTVACGRFDPHARDGEALALYGDWARLTCARGQAAIAGTLFGTPAGGDGLLQGATGLPDGRYAMAACDAGEGRLVLARDPAGSVGMFWHRDRNGCIHFATRLDLLVARMPAAPALSPGGLHEYLRFLDIAAPNTIYDGVHALPAGCAMSFDARGEHAAPPPAASADVPNDYATACDAVEARLSAAIARRLDGSPAPGCFLSGGIDSALLCALARHGGFPVKAFTVGFDTPSLDESATAAQVARQLGVEHHIVRPDIEALESTFHRAHAQAEQPYCDPAGMPTRLAFEACMQHADRVLDGTGAEALAGEMPARWRRVAHDWIAPWPPALRRAGASLLHTLPGLGGYARMFDFDAPQDLFIRWHGFTPNDIERLTGRAPDLSVTNFHRQYEALRYASHLRRQSVLQGLALPDDRLQQAALATGLRVEQPFGDPAVAALLQALPADWCWRPDRPKRLLRDLLSRYVPETSGIRPSEASISISTACCAIMTAASCVSISAMRRTSSACRWTPVKSRAGVTASCPVTTAPHTAFGGC